MDNDNPIPVDAERAGMLAALHALTVGTLSTLKRKGLLSSEDIDHLFEAGLVVFERGEQDAVKQAARLTLEILAQSLRDPPRG
jgi:acyl-CoA synthetase (NDP forming)